MNTLADTPVLIKRPSEGALVGGSPFVVSRVYGQGPEVIGEKTPEAAYRRHAKLKALGASQHTARTPGLAQDLFGAGSSSANNTRGSSQASASADLTRWKGKGREEHPSAPDPPHSSNTINSGWVRDSELEHDLFDRPDAKKLHRHSLGVSSSSNVSEKMSASTRVLNPISKPANVYRNSIGGSNQSQGPDPPTSDMTSFLNELRSAGKDKLRKTVSSLKYYNPQQHFGSQKATVISPDQMPLPRNLDPQNAELINRVIGQTFGSQSTLKLSESQTTCQQSDMSSCSSRPMDVADGHSARSASNTSLLSRKVYPSSMSFETRPPNKASSGSSARPTLLSSVANRKSFHVEPKADASLDTSQADTTASSIQADGTERPRLLSDPTPSPPREKSTQNNQTNSQTITKSGLRPRSGKGIDLGPSRLSKAESFGQSISSRALSVIDPNRLPSHTSILSPSKSNEDSPFMKSVTSLSTNSSCTARRVRIVEDPAALKRSSLRSSSHAQPQQQQQPRPENHNAITDENLRSVVEEEEEIIGVGTGLRKPNHIVGYGVGPGAASSTSGSDWIVVKSDSNRLGDGEPNLRRWNLKPLAMISAHPKIMDEN
ncbi:uncharacterized protein MELLADRAFT_74602 [Melampsora larici-populina 98AG31]|uniref:Uncharacterized protein n=1 Tax=Melampsora larici-populina (strain 98AG31 / pathotype 3-4-7) TaxID=747676 RepID=F4RHX5_MELLP|nr:uncharacterized protein MELLADRAFT_74602 [Melampsora larici-populina 98AG31]EGG07900.1 hypothetical protein MELLADRAFT_74602 [Melampsora larici-populina 98AG31]